MERESVEAPVGGLEFLILGPLEVRSGRRTLTLPGPRPRALLALLILNANRVVSVDRLADELWDGRPPPTARAALQMHVGALRKALGDDGTIETKQGGYMLRVAPDRVDATVFERAVESASRDIASDPARCAGELRVALGMWRGDAMGELADTGFARLEAARLEELRLTALEERVAADLACGRHSELVGELAGLVGAHPHREGFRAQLMLALYRAGRQADALAEYTRARTYLSDELGLEPGTELRRLQAAILAHDPALDRPAVDVRSAGVGEASLMEPLGHGNGNGTGAVRPNVPPGITPRTSEGQFVGREACLEQLRRRWRESQAGRTNLVLLVAEPGMGKTRLATQFAGEVHAAGGIALYGRADVENLLPYQPFADLLEQLAEHADAQIQAELARQLEVLSQPFPGLRARAGGATAALDQDTMRYQVFEAVVALIRRACERCPVLVVLDDMQWADQPTLLLLRHLLRHAEGARMLVIGTFRQFEVRPGHPLNDLLADLRRDRRYDRINLEGLDEEATAQLVADRSRVEVTPAFIQRLRAQTDGNVFFIEETLRALEESEFAAGGVVGEDSLDALGVPEGVAQVILRRARQLSPLAGELLTAASVVGPSVQLRILQHLVDATLDEVIDAAEDGLAAGLILESPDQVDVLTFPHALVREVLYGQLTRSRRIVLHHRVAEALERLSARGPVNPAELAHHFALAAPVAGAEPARRYAIEAARRAAEAFAYEEAVQHYRRALALFDAEQEAQRCDVLLELGRVQWHAGDEGARETFLEAADSASGRDAADQLARAALGLGERYFEVTYLGLRYRDVLEQALTAIGPSDSPRRAMLLARLAVNLGFPDEDLRGQDLAAEAVGIARRIGDEKLLVTALLARHITLLDVRHIERRLALDEELSSLSVGHEELAAEGHHWRMYDLLEVGDIDAARRAHASLERLADKLGQPLLRSLAAGARGLLAELAGDEALADRCADESLRQARLAHTHDAVSSWACQLFALRRRQGRIAELTPVVERLATSGGRPLGWLAALAVLRLETGDEEDARLIYEQEMGAGAGGLPRGMFWLTRIALLAEVAARLGDVDGACGLYEQLAPQAARNVVVAYCSLWGPVDGYLALLAQTCGDDARARRHASAAIQRVTAMGAPMLRRDLEERYDALGVRVLADPA